MNVGNDRQGKQPPHDIYAEQHVLGAILIDGDAIGLILESLKPSDFYKKKHGAIYEAMVSLAGNADPTDIVSVADVLLQNNALDDIGGRGELIDLAANVATSANIEHHAKIIKDKSVMRQLISASTAIAKSCFQESSSPDNLLDLAEQTIFDISEHRTMKDFVLLEDLLPQTFQEIEEFHKRGGQITGLSCGFDELDALTSGMHKSEMIVVAGRPSMGKTAFALNIAEHVALKEKIPVGIFSLEMSKAQLTLRLLCAHARVNSHALRTGRLKSDEWPKLAAATGPLSESQIWIDDTAGLGILELRAKARRLKKQHDLGLVMIDYMQMMRGPTHSENRQQEIAQISRSLKGMAKELEIPVIALSQLSRGPEQRGGDRKPQLADLRESGAIEQDADVVMFIYRPERYDIKKDSDGRSVENVAEIIISKQRNGPTGTVRLAFLKEYVRFENLAAPSRESEPVGVAGAGGMDSPF